ncbi:hypothetical protein C1645_852479 [Glomus cerebriforme]|uniref:J domain-containing protein n=1 Tax=Glomus cerebriforme TaxID=658196 RepID=A0A397SS57_9GLOM|nr:hypothetical protein C1645_852479 [Glomus cerebriforme]
MITQIEFFFSETKNLIESQLQDNIQNKDEIKKKFRDGKKLIDELEEDDVEQYRIFKYKYHTTYAIYLKTVGEVDNATKQQNLANEYEKYTKKPEGDNYKTDSILFKNATLDVAQDFNPEEKFVLDDVEEQLGRIQNILGDNIIETIKQIFKQFNEMPKTFKMYQQITEYGAILHKTIDSLIIEGLESSQNSEANEINEQLEQNKNNHELLVDSLNCLKLLTDEATYSKRIDFIQYVLNSSNKKEILFSNILFTEEGINKHSRKLYLYFHPDKTNNPNTPNFLKGEHKTKGQWEKLKLLKKDDIKESSSKELENFSLEKGELAYQEYRAACKIADKSEQLKKQVKLRGNMSLCYYAINKFLEAQLYALSAIQLLFKNSHKVTKQDLIEAKNIFDKVKSGNTTEKTPKLNTEINLSNNSDNALALVKIIDQKISVLEKKRIESSVRKDMKIFFTSFLFLRKDIFKEQIIRKKLNKIMIDALNEYDKGNYQEFLDHLSEKFDEKGTRLFKLKELDDDIDPIHIMDKLLRHGFRSDAIAYLLNLLGEVLNSEKIEIEGKTPNELKELAKKIIRGVLHKKLRKNAKELDDRFNKNCLKTKKHMNDAQYMPFQSSLEEMCNTARINLTIFDVLNGGEEEFERAIKTIKEIRDSINRHFQFINTAKSRLEALEDFLWVISGDVPPGESSEL